MNSGDRTRAEWAADRVDEQCAFSAGRRPFAADDLDRREQQIITSQLGLGRQFEHDFTDFVLAENNQGRVGRVIGDARFSPMFCTAQTYQAGDLTTHA